MKDLNPPDRKSQTITASKVVFLILAVAGAILFYFFNYGLLGGLGLSSCLFALASCIHFRKAHNRASESMDTKMTWFLLGAVVFGVVLMLFNVLQSGPEFYAGIAAGLIFMAALTYGFELTLIWFANLR